MKKQGQFMLVLLRALPAAAVGASAALLSGIGGCTLEPHYQRPAALINPQWPQGPAFGTAPGAAQPGNASAPPQATADIGWREFFTDPLLQKLIELALEHNPDAQVAALNIAAARAQYQIQRADLFPSISATGLEEIEKYPSGVAGLVGASGAPGAGAGSAVGSGVGIPRYYDVGVGFTSYEIDLFGRIRSLDQQRLQQYFAAIETRRAAQISLVAAVASTYLSWFADEELLEITADTLKNQQDSYNLTKMSYDGGVATLLDLRQAETSVDTARANLAQYTRRVAQDQDELVLLGIPLPPDLPAGIKFQDQQLLEDLPPGLPSDLLQRRPDILAAEHTLLAANASIGAARAAFFPSITLTGSYGTASTQLSGLFQPGSSAWTFSPQISLPIFAAGANVAGLDAAKVSKRIEIAQYEKTIQTAFQEVADALAGRATLDDQLTADQALVEASGETYRLAEMRFRSGVDNYLNVLDSQRALYAAQQTLVAVKLARLQNLVTLYKALGGGWNEHTVKNVQKTAGGDAAVTSASADDVQPGPATP